MVHAQLNCPGPPAFPAWLFRLLRELFPASRSGSQMPTLKLRRSGYLPSHALLAHFLFSKDRPPTTGISIPAAPGCPPRLPEARNQSGGGWKSHPQAWRPHRMKAKGPLNVLYSTSGASAGLGCVFGVGSRTWTHSTRMSFQKLCCPRLAAPHVPLNSSLAPDQASG